MLIKSGTHRSTCSSFRPAFHYFASNLIACGGRGKRYYSSIVLRIVVGTERASQNYCCVLPFVGCSRNYENFLIKYLILTYLYVNLTAQRLNYKVRMTERKKKKTRTNKIQTQDILYNLNNKLLIIINQNYH